MNLLTEQDRDVFLERFNNCYDGVVRSVELVYPYGWFTRPGPAEREVPRANVVLSVPDLGQGGAWHNLRLVAHDVREFRVLERHGGSNPVLSDGLKLGWFEGLVFVDIALYDHDQRDGDEFRKGGRFIAARELYWQVEPYDR